MPKPLPFVVQPKVETRDVGTPEVGFLRFPVLKCSLLAERLMVREIDRSDEIFERTGNLVIAVVDRMKPDPLPEDYDRDLEIAKTYAMVTRIIADLLGTPVGGLAPMEALISVLFNKELRALAKESQENEEDKLTRTFTAVVSNRLEGYKDWTDEDSRKMPEDLIAAVYQFHQAERARQEAPPSIEEQQKALEAALGELRPADGSRPPNPIGEPSTGDSGARSPALQSSAPSGSDASPSATSSTPARKRRRSNAADFTTTSSPSPAY